MTTDDMKELERSIERIVLAFEKETGLEVYTLSIGSRLHSAIGERISATFKVIVDKEGKTK